MLTYLNPGQSQHAPRFEFFRGERVPCFEGPARADFVEQALRARGHALRMPEVDSTPQLERIHTRRYLDFLRTAWDQWLALDAANGTQAIFYERADVLFVSIHGDPRTEYPFYLGHADETGSGEGAGCNLNLPLPAGSSAATWFAALEAACARVARHLADALVVSLGLDTFAGDPISTLQLQAADFTCLGQRLRRLGLPVIFVLEGGYAAAALGENAVCVLEGFET